MRAGSMRERITFYKVVKKQRQSGSVKTELEEVYRCRAMLKRGSPVYDKDGVNAREQFRSDNVYMVIRSTKNIDDSMQVKYNNRRYEIIPPIVPNHADRTMEVQIRRINE